MKVEVGVLDSQSVWFLWTYSSAEIVLEVGVKNQSPLSLWQDPR